MADRLRKPVFHSRCSNGLFKTASGFGADVLCGVLDILSHDQPIITWERLHAIVDVDTIIVECSHTTRIATLHRIIARACEAGSKTAEAALTRVRSRFRSGAIQLNSVDNYPLPMWADCISPHWRLLEARGIATRELFDEFVSVLSRICAPYTVADVYDLETAVSRSFRATQQVPAK